MISVLVVEDDPWIQWMIADDLADRGWHVITAGDGAEALQRLREVRPDVIVLDLMLPRVDGWDFADRYLAVTGGQPIPIIVVTATLRQSLPSAACGVRKSLPKPFDMEELAQTVAQLARPEAVTAAG